MLKITDYQAHAGECRRLAASATLPHIRDELLKMADAWEVLAKQREAALARRGSNPEV